MSMLRGAGLMFVLLVSIGPVLAQGVAGNRPPTITDVSVKMEKYVPLQFSEDGKAFYFLAKYESWSNYNLYKSDTPFVDASLYKKNFLVGPIGPYGNAVVVSRDAGYVALIEGDFNDPVFGIYSVKGGKKIFGVSAKDMSTGVNWRHYYAEPKYAFSNDSSVLYFTKGRKLFRFQLSGAVPKKEALVSTLQASVSSLQAAPHWGWEIDGESMLAVFHNGMGAVVGAGGGATPRWSAGRARYELYPFVGKIIEKLSSELYGGGHVLCLEEKLDGTTRKHCFHMLRSAFNCVAFNPAGTLFSIGCGHLRDYGVGRMGGIRTTENAATVSWPLPGQKVGSTVWSPAGDRVAYPSSKGISVATMRGLAPPYLVTRIALDDSQTGGSGAIESGETGFLSVEIENSGPGDSGAIKLKVESEPDVLGGFPKPIWVKGIAGMQKAKLRIPILAPADLKSGPIKITVNTTEAKGFDAKQVSAIVEGRTIPLPQLALKADVGVVDTPQVVPEKDRLYEQKIGAVHASLLGSVKQDVSVSLSPAINELFAKCLADGSHGETVKKYAFEGVICLRGRTNRAGVLKRIKLLRGRSCRVSAVGLNPRKNASLKRCVKRAFKDAGLALGKRAGRRSVEIRTDLNFVVKPPAGAGVRIVGDGDGKLESGEIARLVFKVSNNGKSPSYHPRVDLLLSSNVCPSRVRYLTKLGPSCSANLVVGQMPMVGTNGPIHSAVLEPGKTARCSVYLQVMEDAQVENVKIFAVLLERRSRRGCLERVEKVYDVKLTKKLPMIDFAYHIRDGGGPGNSRGNNNGKIEQGEIIELELRIANRGEVSVPSSTLRVSSPMPGIMFQNSQKQAGVLRKERGVQVVVFVFTVQRSVPSGEIPVQIQIVPGRFPVVTRTLALEVGTAAPKD